MRFNLKKVTVWILIFTLVLPLINNPFDVISYAAENGVTVTVTDAMGIKGTVSNTSGFSEEINPN